MYEPVIGLEIHAQLQTATKLFCGCSTAWDAAPNSLTCPVCLGLPGALPALNGRAVELAVLAAVLLDCRVQTTSVFARKHYFYPDLPKGYQITQYDRPLAVGGRLEWSVAGVGRHIRIERVHVEEDAGKSMHGGAAGGDAVTLLDFNRSGVPLIEIVTAPDLRSAGDAAEFFRRLRTVLVAAGVNDGNMEQGSLRCDANVSVRPRGEQAMGARTEIKNLNSFRFLERALDFEIGRQRDRLARGEAVAAETRLWDDRRGETVLMRRKEGADDYRYFAEPDLPPLVVDEATVARARLAVPELPDVRRSRLANRYGLTGDTLDHVAGSAGLTAFFEQAVAAGADAPSAAAWIKGELARRLHERGGGLEALALTLTPQSLARLVVMVSDGLLSASAAKTVFARICGTGEPPDEAARAEQLLQVSDGSALGALVAETLARFPEQVAQVRGGRTAAVGFLVGQVIKASQGRANPRVVDRLVRESVGLPE